MKNIKAIGLSVFITFVLNGSVAAQGWFPLGASWTYDYADQLFTGYVSHVVTGDSVIDGRTCRVINVVRTYGYDQNVYTLQLDPYCVYDSAGLSFIHVPGVGFDTLYNMNAQVGDRWMLSELPEQCDSTSFLEVADTGHVVIDGISLRWLAVDRHFPQLGWSLQDTVIERLGTLSYLPPQNACLAAVDGSEGGALRCYLDADINFKASWADVCEISLGFQRLSTSELQMRVYPNPGGEVLNVEYSGHGPMEVLITDVTGRAVSQTLMQEGTNKLCAGQWASGLYHVRVVADGGSRSLRWVKQ